VRLRPTTRSRTVLRTAASESVGSIRPAGVAIDDAADDAVEISRSQLRVQSSGVPEPGKDGAMGPSSRSVP